MEYLEVRTPRGSLSVCDLGAEDCPLFWLPGALWTAEAEVQRLPGLHNAFIVEAEGHGRSYSSGGPIGFQSVANDALSAIIELQASYEFESFRLGGYSLGAAAAFLAHKDLVPLGLRSLYLEGLPKLGKSRHANIYFEIADQIERYGVEEAYLKQRLRDLEGWPDGPERWCRDLELRTVESLPSQTVVNIFRGCGKSNIEPPVKVEIPTTVITWTDDVWHDSRVDHVIGNWVSYLEVAGEHAPRDSWVQVLNSH